MKKAWGTGSRSWGQQDEVAIVARSETDALRLSIELSGLGYANNVIESPDPIAAALRALRGKPAVILTVIDGREIIVDIRELVSRADPTRLVFLTHEAPPSAALARLLHAHGAALLPVQTPPMVLAATLVALLSQHAQGVT